MVDGSVESKGEGVSGPDANSLGRSGFRTQVTSQVVGAEICDGGVVVCVLADVLPHGVLGAPDGQLLEDVMSRDVAHCQREGSQSGESLHDGGAFGLS